MGFNSEIRYYRAYFRRGDVSAKIKNVKAKSIVFIGGNADQSEGLKVQGLLMPDRTDYIIVKNHATLLTETAVPKLLNPLRLWFNSQGFFKRKPQFEDKPAASKQKTCGPKTSSEEEM